MRSSGARLALLLALLLAGLSLAACAAVALGARSSGQGRAGASAAASHHGKPCAKRSRSAPRTVSEHAAGWGWRWPAGSLFAGSRQGSAPGARRSRGCRRKHRKGAARHGVSTTTPVTGPPGSPGAAGGSGSAGGGSGGASTPGGGKAGEVEEGSGPPVISHVQVTSVEYHFTLSRTSVPAGKVAFDFVNAGQDEHNLNVLSGEGSIAGSFPNTVSKGIRDQTIELRHGSYTLFCSLPEHESKGMKATLTVE